MRRYENVQNFIEQRVDWKDKKKSKVWAERQNGQTGKQDTPKPVGNKVEKESTEMK
jgi:hypothetical protein